MYAYLQIDDLEESDTVIDNKDVTEDNIDPIPEINETDENELNTLSDKYEVGNLKEEEKTTDNSLLNKRRKRRRDAIKREYSDDMLASAINDLRLGQTLIEAATKHNIPRSTLYMRAKALGIHLNASRNEYPAECMKAAINAVIGQYPSYRLYYFFIKTNDKSIVRLLQVVLVYNMHQKCTVFLKLYYGDVYKRKAIKFYVRK